MDWGTGHRNRQTHSLKNVWAWWGTHGDGLGFKWQGRKKKKKQYIFLSKEPETSTVYQFYGCHWHGHTCLKNRTKRQELRYKNTCQIDWLIKNNGWDTEYNLVSTWDCEKPISKKMWFEKIFSSYPHFIVYHLEARLVPLNERPTDAWHIYQGT